MAFADQRQALLAEVRDLKRARRGGGPIPGELRARRLGRLRRHFNRGAHATRFFERLASFEGGDPMHMWLFPGKCVPLQEDAAVSAAPKALPSYYYCRARPTCLR